MITDRDHNELYIEMNWNDYQHLILLIRCIHIFTAVSLSWGASHISMPTQWSEWQALSFWHMALIHSVTLIVFSSFSVKGGDTQCDIVTKSHILMLAWQLVKWLDLIFMLSIYITFFKSILKTFQNLKIDRIKENYNI